MVKIQIYGTIKFIKKSLYKHRLPHSHLILNLDKIVSKGIEYMPENLTLDIPIPHDLYESLKKQTEKSKGKLKIKLKGDLECIVKITDE